MNAQSSPKRRLAPWVAFFVAALFLTSAPTLRAAPQEADPPPVEEEGEGREGEEPTTETTSTAVEETAPLTPGQRLRDEIGVLALQAESVLALLEGKESISPEVQSLADDVRQTLAEADATHSSTPIGTLTEIRDRLLAEPPQLRERIYAAPAVESRGDGDPPAGEPFGPTPEATTPVARPESPATDGPPAFLREAARALFSGRYDEAVTALRDLPADGRRVELHGRLLRAAARHALYLRGGSRDDTLRDAARRDVEACKRLNPSLFPDPTAFSPAFRAFFDAS